MAIDAIRAAFRRGDYRRAGAETAIDKGGKDLPHNLGLFDFAIVSGDAKFTDRAGVVDPYGGVILPVTGIYDRPKKRQWQ